MTASAARRPAEPPGHGSSDLDHVITTELRRWPSAGLAVVVVERFSRPVVRTYGVADAVSGRPVTDHTVFRIGSLTKTITAVAVMQLVERGLVDLDAPANDYLRAFRLVPGRPGFSPVTVRHLLTHTAGLGYWRRRSDLLLRPGLGAGVRGREVVPPAELYREGLVTDVEPGTRWMYSNHGFAALGQVVEDVTGVPFGRYLRRHVFSPLGMDHTDLLLPDRPEALATGYRLGRRGLVPVPLRPVPVPASGGVCSTAGDMARYLEALLQGGANQHGRMLTDAGMRQMFHPSFRPDPRVAGMALGFEPHVERGRVLIGKGGTVDGFLSALELAPENGVGVVVLTNTGGLDNRGIAEPLTAALTRRLLGMPADPVRDDVAPHPEVWRELCGWYTPDAGPNTNAFLRLGFGAGLAVTARHDHLVLRPLQPVPGMSASMVLHPDDPTEPRVFRVVFPRYDTSWRIVFTDDLPPRLLLDVMSFEKQPSLANRLREVAGGRRGPFASGRRRAPIGR